MLLIRNRSRAVTKPPLMADHTSSSQPSTNARTIPNSLFASPKFRDFTNKCLSGTEHSLRSPTSTLDSKALSLSPFGFGINPFSYANNTSQNDRSSTAKIETKSIGLALLGALEDEPFHDNSAEPNKGNVLFGTQLRVKVPPLPPSTAFSDPFESQTCADDFGTKTKDSQNSGIYNTKESPTEVVDEVLSLSEMELSEEYTCVISHGPNPKTIHIFNNCIVESYCSLPQQNSRYASANFLSFCYTCKKHLDQTKDIFIYR